jgi:hypothetical protein
MIAAPARQIRPHSSFHRARRMIVCPSDSQRVALESQGKRNAAEDAFAQRV